jgi:hypothetical protein
MIVNLLQLEEAIEELNIKESCKLRISRDGEEIFKIIGLTCVDDEEHGMICDIHLEKHQELHELN